MNDLNNKRAYKAIAYQLTFEAYPHRLIAGMVYKVTFWLNSFHTKMVYMTQ